MSSGGGGSKPPASIQPSLQPKPIAMSPIRPAIQGLKFGQPMVPQAGGMVQHMGQSQFMVGTVAQGLPLHMSQPRMTSQVLQPQGGPRMAMYVPGQTTLGQVAQQNMPKIVTGLPVYQNTAQFPQGAIRIQPSPIVTGTSASVALQSPPPQMTLAMQSGQGQIQGQFQQLGSGSLRPAQLIQAGHAIPGQVAYRPAGPLTGTSFGFSGLQLRNIRPATQTQTLPGVPQSIQPKPPGPTPGQMITSPTSLSTLPTVSTQFVTPLTQIPTPQFFTSPPPMGSPIQSSGQFLSPTSSTPLSPLVPLSPNMFQVARTVGQTQIFTSPATLPQIQSAILPFHGQCGGTLVANPPQLIPAISTQQSTPATVTPVMTNSTKDVEDAPTDLSKKPVSPRPAPEQAEDKLTQPATENKCTQPATENKLIQPDTENTSMQPATEENSAADMESFKENVLNLRVNKDVGKPKPDENEQKETVAVNNEPVSVLDSSAVDTGAKDKNTDGAVDEKMADNQDEEIDAMEKVVSSPGEEPEFVWEEYLQEVGASAVPPTAFKHVEFSLQSGFVKGMKLEVPNKSDPASYWVSTVLMTCGPLLRLRYDGYEDDSSADFWCELATSEIHPIGWCAQNGKNLQPPEEIKDKFADWREFLMQSLTGARTSPSYLLDKETGTTPIDQLKPGTRLELQESLTPLSIWLVQVIENVGGRLYLRLEGTQSSSHYFWMFYLNPRLHPIGWGKQEGCSYVPPKEIHHEHGQEKWAEILEQALKESEENCLPVDVFKDQVELKPHRFEVGMKLEALNPGQNMVSPATVCKVISNKYFIIEIDDLRPQEQRESVQICCHSEYLGIFPVSWCQCKGIRLVNPRGWKMPEFVWGDYLNFCGAKAAPEKLFNSGTDDHEFERGMKLEAVNPDNPNQICAATITKIVGPLLWIHLDHVKDIPSHIEDIDSHGLFPVGWCESNGYQLKPPRKLFGCRRPRHFSESLYGEALRSDTYSHVKSGNEGGSWCPVIYFNHRCFSGPFLSKGRISELPKSVGPGPMGLVLKEVLTLLINVAYKSCKVLKELQLEGPPNPNMDQQVLKAKYKGKSYRGAVQVCRTEAQLEEFCRNVCIKLECCPYLFSVLFVEDICPENCQQLTKTKYNYNYGKKKKRPVGRPPLSTTQKENGNKVPGKRGRKRKRFHLIHKKSHSATADNQYKYLNGDVYTNNDNKDEGFIDDYRVYDGEDHYRNLTPSKKRKYTHHIPPPSDIQTRGAKLPKYSFERKTHKKILHTPASPPNKAKPKAALLKEILPDVPTSLLSPQEESLQLSSNPLYWSVGDVVDFMKNTDCVHLARIIKEQDIDGQALLLLNLSTIQEHLDLKLGPAVKLCHQIERLKIAFFESYA